MDYNAFTASEDTGFSRLYGFYVAENGSPAAVARVNIRDGGASGPIVIPIELGADESVGENGLNLPAKDSAGNKKWYVEVVGSVVGSIIGG